MVAASGEEGGLVIVSVPANSAGVEVKSYRLMDGSSVSDVSFDRVALDEQAVIVADHASEAALSEMMTLATAIVCADSLKQIEVMLAATVSYLNSRSQFGTRLAGFQVLQHRLSGGFRITFLDRCKHPSMAFQRSLRPPFVMDLIFFPRLS
jgi:alkylation response protein AidB-like acyl-CoA dehydrogenase